MASNYTENYQLCQWEATDQVQRTEFNADNAKVDVALAALETALTARNCQIDDVNYTGTGSTSRVYYFTRQPILVLAMGPDHWMCGIYNAASGVGASFSGGSQKVSMSWTTGTMTASGVSDASYICNASGVRYRMISIEKIS